MNENVIKTELTKLRMRELNLSYKGITDEVLRDMRFDGDITNIDLSFNSIQNFNVRFPDGLQRLSLSGNQIQNLDNVRFPDGLQELYLYGNQIKNLDNVRFPDGLQILYLDNNQIQNLDNVRFPDGLQVLHLSNNQIKNLDNVRFPDGLQILYLHNNQIQNLDINMCWVLPSTKIYAENELINAIRKSTQNMAAIRIQHCYCQHLIRRNRAALTIQIQYVAYSYRIHGVAYQNAMKQHIEIT